MFSSERATVFKRLGVDCDQQQPRALRSVKRRLGTVAETSASTLTAQSAAECRLAIAALQEIGLRSPGVGRCASTKKVEFAKTNDLSLLHCCLFVCCEVTDLAQQEAHKLWD